MNLSIKNVPDEIVRHLKFRAERNHRSLQGELMAIVEAAAKDVPKMTPGEIIERLGNARLLAPAILAFELTNICWKKCRREPNRRQELIAALRLRLAFDIEEKPVDHDAVLALALETGLTAYDASYLWLARHFGVELVTLDQALARAAIV